MKIYHVVLLVLLTVILSAGVFSAQTTTTIKVVEHADTDAVTDTGDEGDTVGDILTFANEVYDEANANQVGTDNGYCFRTAVSEAWECAWTLKLDDGQITVQGPFYDAGDSMLSITGGTGAYASASGQMTLHDRNGDGTEYDFTYEITQ
jgi:allene oxide cyclase